MVNLYHQVDFKLWPGLEQAQCWLLLHRSLWCFVIYPLLSKLTQSSNLWHTCALALFYFQIVFCGFPLVPLFLGNPCFAPGLQEGAFRSLLELGRYQASHFLLADTCPILQALMDVAGLFKLDFWRAALLHHFLHSLSSPHKYGWNLTTLEEYCSNQGSLPHTLSKMYHLLVTTPNDFQLSFLAKWESDLGMSFTAGQWTNIVWFALKS